MTGANVPEDGVHPIVEFAASLLSKREDDSYFLDETGALRLEQQLAKHYEDESLRRAVADLIRLACHLDTEVRSPAAAAAILDVLAHAVEPLRALDDPGASKGGVPDDVGSAKHEFDRFRGKEPSTRAPKVGEEAPEGSVKLGSLDYPKRG